MPHFSRWFVYFYDNISNALSRQWFEWFSNIFQIFLQDAIRGNYSCFAVCTLHNTGYLNCSHVHFRWAVIATIIGIKMYPLIVICFRAYLAFCKLHVIPWKIKKKSSRRGGRCAYRHVLWQAQTGWFVNCTIAIFTSQPTLKFQSEIVPVIISWECFFYCSSMNSRIC